MWSRSRRIRRGNSNDPISGAAGPWDAREEWARSHLSELRNNLLAFNSIKIILTSCQCSSKVHSSFKKSKLANFTVQGECMKYCDCSEVMIVQCCSYDAVRGVRGVSAPTSIMQPETWQHSHPDAGTRDDTFPGQGWCSDQSLVWHRDTERGGH